MSQLKTYDIFIIGGGINGCGLARDASGRGYRVGLAEMKDLASGTSSASTKLIHGGLRYLEQYAFSLVREALKEREVILNVAPHLVQPLRFLLPYYEQQRPFWLLRLGLFLYDHIGGRKEFLSTKVIDLKRAFRDILQPRYEKAFEYSDARVDDARLVIANARHAEHLGADIMVGWKVVSAAVEETEGKTRMWRMGIENAAGEKKELMARYVVNAAGPWVGNVFSEVFDQEGNAPVRLVQGSHIVVPKIFSHDRAYIFQNIDRRIVFAIPYEEDFTLIGTTDEDYSGSLEDIKISEKEMIYLCECVNQYFNRTISKRDIIWSYSGVRSLYDDGSLKAQDATRDYVLKEIEKDEAFMLHIFGGKITTYRKLAEDALSIIEKKLAKETAPWTKNVPLPGGDFSYKNLQDFIARLAEKVPNLSQKSYKRLIRSYGTEAFEIFSQGTGRHFGHDFYEAELMWLIKKEWARSIDDILWRRTKLGLHFSETETEELQKFLDNNI